MSALESGLQGAHSLGIRMRRPTVPTGITRQPRGVPGTVRAQAPPQGVGEGLKGGHLGDGPEGCVTVYQADMHRKEGGSW